MQTTFKRVLIRLCWQVGVSTVLMTTSAVAGAAEREVRIPGPQVYIDAWSLYNQKYADAERALACAGFPGLAPKQGGGGSQATTVTPHPAVRHAAEVDAPVRGKGPALCTYISEPRNAKWYADNFRIRHQPRGR